MRYTARAMFSVFLVAWCTSNVMAEDSGHWWWPFGGDHQAAQTPPTRRTAPPRTSRKPRMYRSPAASHAPLDGAHWPEFKLPRLWPSKDEADEVRNAWAQPTTEPQQPSPWHVVTDSAQRLGTSTRNAWDKTVDVLNPFDEQPSPPVAQGEPRPSFWGNLFGAEGGQPQGKRTVNNWMAQERLDP